MKVRFWGVRGSIPVPGRATNRYGGNTSCVEVRPRDAAPIIIDAGTGIRTLGAKLHSDAFQGSILLSHLHWDHMMGIPFSRALDQHTSRVDLYLPTQDGMSARDLLAKTMSPPAFPIEPEGLHGTWSFRPAEDGPTTIEGFKVTATEVAHKGGRTLGYRFRHFARRNFGGRMLDRVNAPHGCVRWVVVPAIAGRPTASQPSPPSQPPDPPSGGDGWDGGDVLDDTELCIDTVTDL